MWRWPSLTTHQRCLTIVSAGVKQKAAPAGRLESFFGPTTVKKSTTGVKRKEPEGKGKASGKGKKAAK